MKRIALLLILTLAPVARAQDMPLSQILIEGEGWSKREDNTVPNIPDVFREGINGPNGSEARFAILSADKSTLYVGYADQDFLWAFPHRGDGKVSKGSPYCPLRLKRDDKSAPVSAIAVDASGRVYAATPAGIQVFDPTGRLCGVLASPSSKKLDGLEVWDGALHVWAGEFHFVRKFAVKAVK